MGQSCLATIDEKIPTFVLREEACEPRRVHSFGPIIDSMSSLEAVLPCNTASILFPRSSLMLIGVDHRRHPSYPQPSVPVVFSPTLRRPAAAGRQLHAYVH